jgi:hypothetical protein
MKATKKKAKIRVSIFLDEDVVKFFKKRASCANAPPYQTQMNAELRAVMERGGVGPYDSLVNNEEFIAAVAQALLRDGKNNRR